MFAATLSLMLATAHAGTDCDLAAPKDVSASMTAVYVDGQGHPVSGTRARDDFHQALTECGMGDSSQAFARWRNTRVAVNGTAVAGVLFPPLWIGTVAAALVAGQERERMELALSEAR